MDCLPSSQHRARNYRRREPEKTRLYQIVAEHLDAFLEQAVDPDGGGLPRFVERELRAYLRCGILAHGFVRVHCHSCGKDAVVAFSCKGRAFCPSCGGRRMADFAAHLIDRVLPQVPVRQWVLSLPIGLRFVLAFDRELCRRARNIFVRAVMGWMQKRAKRRGILCPEGGAVTVTQRFGSALNLNVHFHSLVLDGVFASTAIGPPPFQVLDPPSRCELALILARIRSRILSMLRRQGALTEDSRINTDPIPADARTLAACAAASIQRRVALGPQSGRPIARRRDAGRKLPYRFVSDHCVEFQGFSMHAGVRIPAHDRDAIEHLCRYLLRPPLADDRISVNL